MNTKAGWFVYAIRGPITLITLGVLFALNNFTPYRFEQTWPVLLIVFGLLTLLRRGVEPPTPVAPPPPPYAYAPPRAPFPPPQTPYAQTPYAQSGYTPNAPAPPAEPVQAPYAQSGRTSAPAAPPEPGPDPDDRSGGSQ